MFFSPWQVLWRMESARESLAQNLRRRVKHNAPVSRLHTESIARTVEATSGCRLLRPSLDFLPFLDELPDRSRKGDIPQVSLGELRLPSPNSKGPTLDFARGSSISWLLTSRSRSSYTSRPKSLRRSCPSSWNLRKAGTSLRSVPEASCPKRLKEKLSDGKIDDLLAPDNVSYRDIVSIPLSGGRSVQECPSLN